MISLTLVVLVLLLTWASVGQNNIGVSVVGPLSYTAFSCLKDQGFIFFTVRIYKVSGTPGVDPSAVQTLINANAAGPFMTFAYMEVCRGADASAQVDQMINEVPTTLYKGIWIKVEPNNTPGCSWETYNKVDNCAYITQILTAVHALSPTALEPIGIFTTAPFWQNFFGSDCNYLGDTEIPLSYANYHIDGHVDTTQSYADFIPFGGWSLPTAPTAKQIAGNTTVQLCGNPEWHAFVDKMWSAL